MKKQRQMMGGEEQNLLQNKIQKMEEESLLTQKKRIDTKEFDLIKQRFREEKPQSQYI